jgi:hypothetical protein
MDNRGFLWLDCVDVYGRRIRDLVTIRLKHCTLSESKVGRDIDASKAIVVKDLMAAPNGLYRLEVWPEKYLPVSRFVNITEKTPRLKLQFAVNRERVTGLRFSNECGDGLPDLERACLANITAKARHTMLPAGKSVADCIASILEVRQDRVFAMVAADLLAEIVAVARAGDLVEVSGALHSPPAGFKQFKQLGSYKSRDLYGNIQITLFHHEGRYLADLDIDDAGGILHIFQVLRNAITGRPTHPYDIHEILLGYQHIDPGYALLV